MNKVILLLTCLFLTSEALSQEAKPQDIAIGNIKWGMTRREVKDEFNAHKNLYTNYKIGDVYYRYYYQNNSYDKNGGLEYVRLTIKGGGMYGVQEVVARTAFKDLIQVLRSQEFVTEDNTAINDIEFTREEVFEFHNKELDKTVYIALIGSQGNVFLNVGIMRYQGGEQTEESAKSGF